MLQYLLFSRLDEYREEIEVLRAERDHLEKSNMDLRKKVSDFRSMQTPVSLMKIESVYRNLIGKLPLIHDNIDRSKIVLLFSC